MLTATIDEVKDILVQTLGLAKGADELSASTPLFGSLPELDSLGVVELAAALEEHFNFEIDGDELTADIFETVGTLSEFVERKIR
jgi:acyl carrier protein